MEQQQQELSLQRVPAELQKRIANFLQYRDAFRFSQVNRQIQDYLGMSKIRVPYGKGTNFKWAAGGPANGNLPCRSITIPLVMKNRVHTVVLHGMYHDQGWGNNHGKLYVVASQFADGRHTVVAESPPAKHRESPLALEFNTVDDDVTYSLWYKVGGGEGHTLSLSNLSMELILFDEPSFYISKNFHALDSRQALSLQPQFQFHFMLLQKAARVLLEQIEQGEHPDINMTSFMESTGIDMNPKSLLALDQITSSMMETSLAEQEEEFSLEDDEIRRQCFPLLSEQDEEEAPDVVLPQLIPRMMEVEPPQGELLGDDDDALDVLAGMERDMEDMEAMIRRAMQDD